MTPTPKPANPSGKKSNRWWRWPLYGVLSVLVLLAVALGGALWWASTPGSLPRALSLAQTYLPAEQSLTFEDAQGSIVHGGHIGQVSWQSPAVGVTLDDLTLDWNLWGVFKRQLRVQTLQAKEVQLRLTAQAPQPKPADAPFEMPAAVTLPLHVTLPVQVDTLTIASEALDGTTTTQTVEHIALRYDYDGARHDLQLQSLQYAQSALQAQVSLGAKDLALEGQAMAYVAAVVPDADVRMAVPLQIKGTLAAGDAARIDAELKAVQLPADFEVPAGANGLLTAAFAQSLAAHPDWDKAQVGAQVHPWRKQPLESLDVRLIALNAQEFAAQAPATSLNGTISLQPSTAAPQSDSDASLKAAQWPFTMALVNDKAGLWDQGQLPLRRLNAHGVLALNGLELAALTAELGAQGQGNATLSGHVNFDTPSDAGLRLGLKALDLQQLLSGLPLTELQADVRLAPAPEDVAHAPQEGGQALPDSAASVASSAASAAVPAPASPLSSATQGTTLAQARWQAVASIENTAMGALDAQRLPLSRVDIDATVGPQLWQLSTAAIYIGQGRLEASGQYSPQSQEVQLMGQLDALPLREVLTQLAREHAPDLSGTFSASGNVHTALPFAVDITGHEARASAASPAHAAATTPGKGKGTGKGTKQAAAPEAVRHPWNIRAVQAQGQWTPERLRLESLNFDALQAKIEASDFELALPSLDAVAGTLSARAPGLRLEGHVAMQQNEGKGQIDLAVESAEHLLQWLKGLPIVGEQMPAVTATGKAHVHGDWTGGFAQWIEGLRAPESHPNLKANLALNTEGLKVAMAGPEGKPNAGLDVDIRTFKASAQGNLRQAALLVDGDVWVDGSRAQVQTNLQMRQLPGAQAAWRLVVEQLSANATLPQQSQPWRLAVEPGAQVSIYPSNTGTRVDLSAASASLVPPEQVAPAGEALKLHWQASSFEFLRTGALRAQSKGGIDGLHVGWIDALVPGDAKPLAQAGISTTLVMAGQWDVSIANTVNIQASLARTAGDIRFGQPTQAFTTANGDEAQIFGASLSATRAIGAGARVLGLTIQSQGSALSAQFNWDSERAGTIAAQVQTQFSRRGQGWVLAKTAPLTGTVKAGFPDLNVLGFLAPPGWRIAGAVNADLTVAGTLALPELRGRISGDGLSARSILDGVDLHNGRLRAELGGHRLTVTELNIEGGTGSTAYVPGVSGNKTLPPKDRGSLLLANGFIDWGNVASAKAAGQSDAGLDMDMKIQLMHMQVLSRNDRQITLSGDLEAAMRNGALRLRGDLTVNRASITLPDAGAPTLGDDVVVIRKNAPQPDGQVTARLETAKPMDMVIKLNLGSDFALQGYGLTTRLGGELTISSTKSGNPPIRIVGEIHTDQGRYRAWGQALNIETGTILFNGPYDNPSLNILAVRPNIDVVAGVRVTGTASSPRIQLYSEPHLPDAETLSWVVLGRSAAAGGAEGNAMQQAALGLVAGEVGKSLAGGLGLDEVGVSAEGLSVGKRLSDQLYVTYVASMTGAGGTLYILYDISRRLTARAQTGEQSAVDLIYTMTFD